jgi:hypothetical protein
MTTIIWIVIALIGLLTSSVYMCRSINYIIDNVKQGKRRPSHLEIFGYMFKSLIVGIVWPITWIVVFFVEPFRFEK